jgi:uncharacterized protein
MRIIFACLAAVALVQCHSPDPTLYTLVPVAGTSDAAPAGAVALARMEVAHYLDRPQIVRRHDAYALATDDAERWAEPLDEMMPRVLVAELTERLPHMRIAQSSSGMLGDADRSLAVSIERFDVDPDGTVVLDARWSVRGRTGAGPLDTAEIREHAASSDTDDLVAAMSRCLAELSDRLAASLAAAQ